MKKIFLTLFALLAFAFNVQADNIVSGQKYKIVTLDGTKALSCGEVAKNDVRLTLTNLSDTEEGQVWVLTQNGDYWGITSAMGAFNIDNPSEAHDKFENKLCLWQTNGGDNQKWTFEAADDDSYYMIPLENAAKCYALDANGNFTFQDKGADTRVKLVKYVEPVITIDGITSGKYYQICTFDTSAALSNNGSTANNTILTMQPFDVKDEGQIWQINRSGNYWTIKSSVGNVNIDNPSASNNANYHKLLQWQTSGGDNQKWTFEKADDNSYYMVPFENAEKCYGYNADGTMTFQDKTSAVRVKLVEAKPVSLANAVANGYYCIQAVSVFPDYNYNSEGRFVSFDANGNASLSTDYTYQGSRLLISTNDEGVATLTLPQSGANVTVDGNAVKSATTAEASKFVLFLNEDEWTLDSHLAIHAGSTTDAKSGSTLSFVAPNAAGSALTIANKVAKNAFTFRLVPLPASAETDRLQQTVSSAQQVLATLRGEKAEALKQAIALAQSELDYPYLTANDVAYDVEVLNGKVAELTGQGDSSVKNFGEVTSISNNQTSAAKVYTKFGGIVVENANHYSIYNAAGQQVNNSTALPHGTYVVVADGQVVKVVL